MIQKVGARWRKVLTDSGWERAFVALVNGQIVGHLDLEGGEIYPAAHRIGLSMGIEFDFKGRGIGSGLMKQAVAFANGLESISWIDLGVFDGNSPAQKFYTKFGFAPTGRIPDKFRCDGKSISDIQMSLKIH